MEGLIVSCPPAWEPWLPPGILRAEGVRELAERCWPLLALTRRGCEELGGAAALCRVLLAPGDCGPELATSAAETVVTYGLSARDSLTLSSLTEPVLCVQRRLPRPDGGFVEPQEFPLPWSAGAGGGASAAAGRAAVAGATDNGPLSVVSSSKRRGPR